MNIDRMLNQTAVWWNRTGADEFGMSEFADGVEIDCRWEQKHELFRDDRGREVQSNAIVYPDQDLTVGDMLYLGALADLNSNLDDPTQVEAWTVRQFEKSPDVKGTTFIRKAWL